MQAETAGSGIRSSSPARGDEESLGFCARKLLIVVESAPTAVRRARRSQDRQHVPRRLGLSGQHPYKGTKLMVAYFGGTRQPMAVAWPARIKPDPTPRPQFHHVIDIAPTIYELTKIASPRVVNGVEQDPIEGVSMAYAFADAKAPGTRHTQFFDIMASRAIYHDGWVAAAPRSSPRRSCPRARPRSRSNRGWWVPSAVR